FGLYQFTGAPAEEIDLVRVSASALSTGGTVYVALANYATSRWQFLTPSTDPVSEFTFPAATADYTSPVSGQISVLVALWGGDSATIDSVALSFPDRN